MAIPPAEVVMAAAFGYGAESNRDKAAASRFDSDHVKSTRLRQHRVLESGFSGHGKVRSEGG
jgi:hypothetical protein